jgi:hypothetical protein
MQIKSLFLAGITTILAATAAALPQQSSNNLISNNPSGATSSSCFILSKAKINQNTQWWFSEEVTVKNTCPDSQILDGTSLVLKNNQAKPSAFSINSIQPWSAKNNATFVYNNDGSLNINIHSDLKLSPNGTTLISFGGNPGLDAPVGDDSWDVSIQGSTPIAKGTLNTIIYPEELQTICSTRSCNIPVVLTSKTGNQVTITTITNNNVGKKFTVTSSVDAGEGYMLSTGLLPKGVTVAINPADNIIINADKTTNATVRFTYSKPAMGSLTYTVATPAKFTPDTNAFTMYLNGPSGNIRQDSTYGNAFTISNLATGTYSVTTRYGLADAINGIYYNAYKNNISIKKDETTNLNTIELKQDSSLLANVHLNISGLENSDKASVKLADNLSEGKLVTQQYIYNSINNLNNGNTILKLLPKNTVIVTTTLPAGYKAVAPIDYTVPLVNGEINIVAEKMSISNKIFLAYVEASYDLSKTPNPEQYNPTFAFILDKNGQPAVWGYNQTDKLSKTKNTWASVGGANGPYPWDYETPENFVKGLKTIVEINNLIGIDFDIEGAAYATPTVWDWTGKVMVLIKHDNKLAKLPISVTLADQFNPGFNDYEIQFLQTVNKAVYGNPNQMAFNYINKMNFDWSGAQGNCSLSSTKPEENCYVISMDNAAHTLNSKFGLSIDQAYAMLGSTYMIGPWGSANGCDDQGICTTPANLENATKILTSRGVSMFGYWQAMGDANGNKYTYWKAIHKGMYGY